MSEDENQPNSDNKSSVTSVVVGELIEVAKNEPKIKEAGSNVAESLAILSGVIKNVLLPLAALNFGVEKARTYFTTRFVDDLSDKVKDIPQSEIVEPKASIVGPVLQGLAFSFEEAELREMYLSLLARSMDGRTASRTHPSFVDIIRQLTAEEAALIKIILGNEQTSIIELRRQTASEGYRVKARHVINLIDPVSGVRYENEMLPAFIENWIRLGLVDVDYNSYLMNEQKYYSWIPTHPKYLEVKAAVDLEVDKTLSVDVVNGIMTRTYFGSTFCEIIGIEDIPDLDD